MEEVRSQKWAVIVASATKRDAVFALRATRRAFGPRLRVSWFPDLEARCYQENEGNGDAQQNQLKNIPSGAMEEVRSQKWAVIVASAIQYVICFEMG
jgi:hypothetical protein